MRSRPTFPVTRDERILLCTAVLMLIGAALTLFGGSSEALAQEMGHAHAPVPSTQLTIRNLDGESIILTPEEFAAMPHKTVSVLNMHTKASETYTGVALTDLLSRAGVPQGEKVRGQLLSTAVIAEGTDKYSVVYALAEVDPSIHTGDVIVADSMNGQKLGDEGAFKMISTEERRPARWVRNLSQISVVTVKL